MAGIFKAYDVRGQYPDELDESAARKIGYSLVRLLGGKTIVVGRDIRLSSPSLSDAFCAGAAQAGAQVTDAGPVSGPLLYRAIISGNFDGGAMITASHLTGEMNGIKLCSSDAVPLSGNKGLPALEKLTGSAPEGKIQPPHNVTRADFTREYIAWITGFVLTNRPVKIVADAGDGMAGPELDLLAAWLEKHERGVIIPMNDVPDGKFPHHGPNPFLPGKTAEMAKRVIDEGADFGVAFDGDADRCIFIDETGAPVAADLATALIAEYFLKRYPGGPILYDLRSSRIVPETIRRSGGRPVRSRVGHAFIKELMRQENAVFAGELSGHYYFKDAGFCDNGIMAMIWMANLLSSKNKTFSELIQPLRKYSSTGEINMRVSRSSEVISALASAFQDAEQDRLDGLTIQYPTWWMNIRPSNTEPLIRLNLEADTLEKMHAKVAQITKIIQETDPGATFVQ